MRHLVAHSVLTMLTTLCHSLQSACCILQAASLCISRSEEFQPVVQRDVTNDSQVSAGRSGENPLPQLGVGFRKWRAGDR